MTATLTRAPQWMRHRDERVTAILLLVDNLDSLDDDLDRGGVLNVLRGLTYVEDKPSLSDRQANRLLRDIAEHINEAARLDNGSLDDRHGNRADQIELEHDHAVTIAEWALSEVGARQIRLLAS